jgi:hypothetical protein
MNQNCCSLQQDIEKIGDDKIKFPMGLSIQQLQDRINEKGWNLTPASNVVLTEVFMGPVTAAICHGPGYENIGQGGNFKITTVAEMIEEVTLIDGFGNIRKINKADTLPDEFNAVIGT